MFSSIITLVGLASAAFAAPVADLAARDAPNSSDVYIENISYGGTGCPQGSVGQFLSDDRTTFTLMFDNFVAQIGPNTTPSDARKSCQVNINLHYPQGFQYSILSTTFRGYVGIEAGVTATQSALYYFSGPSSDQVTTSHTFNGPDTQNYVIDSAVAFTSTIWSPCGASWPLNLKSQVALTPAGVTKTGLMTEDTEDGHVQYITGIQWRSCH